MEIYYVMRTASWKFNKCFCLWSVYFAKLRILLSFFHVGFQISNRVSLYYDHKILFNNLIIRYYSKWTTDDLFLFFIYTLKNDLERTPLHITYISQSFCDYTDVPTFLQMSDEMMLWEFYPRKFPSKTVTPFSWLFMHVQLVPYWDSFLGRNSLIGIWQWVTLLALTQSPGWDPFWHLWSQH